MLIEDPIEGYQFMHTRGPPTKHVKMCFTFADDGDRRKGRVINYTANGGINNSPIAEFRGNLRMQVDREAQIKYVFPHDLQDNSLIGCTERIRLA